MKLEFLSKLKWVIHNLYPSMEEERVFFQAWSAACEDQ